MFIEWGMLMLTAVVIFVIGRRLYARLKTFDLDEKEDKRRTELQQITKIEDFDRSDIEEDDELEMDTSGVVNI